MVNGRGFLGGFFIGKLDKKQRRGLRTTKQ